MVLNTVTTYHLMDLRNNLILFLLYKITPKGDTVPPPPVSTNSLVASGGHLYYGPVFNILLHFDYKM